LTTQYATPEEFDVLIRLGLTLNEARVLMALYASENLTARTVAKSSGVAREIVYQIIPKLQKKGLVDELITNPKTFKAIPLEDVIDVLLQQRKQEDNDLFAKAQEMAKKQLEISQVKNDNSNITLIAPKKGDPNWKRDWDTYKESADMIMPTQKFLQWPQHNAEKSIDDSIKRKITIRMITQTTTQQVLKQPPAKYFSETLASKLGALSYKFIDVTPVEMVIFDKKILYLSTVNEKRIIDMVWLRSNNGFLVEMANNYFETLWENEANKKELKNVKFPF
jgi:sugar-specific transcriptional regulator TrmB